MTTQHGKNRSVQGFYDAEARAYDAERWAHASGAATDRVQAEIVTAMLAQAPPGPFLEVGIGTGRFGVGLSSAERPCLGLDVSLAMLLESARRRRSSGKDAFVWLVQASGTALPFGDATFGACLCINVLSHLRDAGAALAELARVLEPGGVLVANFPNAMSPYLPYALAVRAAGRSLRKGVFTRWYSPREVRRLLGAVGFDVIEVRGQLHHPWARSRWLRKLLGRADAAVRRGALSWRGSIVYVLAVRQ